MDDEKKDWRYEFVVQDVSKDDARLLMDVVEAWVARFGGQVGGGWWEEGHGEEILRCAQNDGGDDGEG